MAFILNTDDDVRAMLAEIGVENLDQLFDCIPSELRLKSPLRIPSALSELELTQHAGALASKNINSAEKPCFLGAGAYDHFVPAAVEQLAGRGEFYTAYTPYQPEASQGTLQAIFEYQTLIAQLTGMDLSNASLYDGGSAVAEAVIMALAVTGRPRVVLGGSIHPEFGDITRTYLANLPVEVETIPTVNGQIDARAASKVLNDKTAALVIQQPNFFGGLEDVEGLVAAAHAHQALAIVSVDPVSLGLLKRPGDYGADIVVAEGQTLGNALTYGGPYLGILACRESFVRKLPGRIVGQTTDRNGKRCWVLTLQTREQHIRREKATSNICTNQGLMALRASIHLALLGPSGLRQAAELSTRKAHYAAESLATVPGIALGFDGPFFKEFVIRIKGRVASDVLQAVHQAGFHGGIALGRWFTEVNDGILIAVTEKRSKEEIDGLVAAYRTALSA
jgi:glycine dehydrogenase subunit 1